MTRAARADALEPAGAYFAYLYVLRVPGLIWLLLVSLPWVSVPRGAVLRGIFDIAGRSLPMSLLSWTLVTLASLFAAMSVAVTARLILVDGHERFGVGRIPRRPGVRLLYRLVPLVLPPLSILGAVWLEADRGGSGVPWWIRGLGMPPRGG